MVDLGTGESWRHLSQSDSTLPSGDAVPSYNGELFYVQSNSTGTKYFAGGLEGIELSLEGDILYYYADYQNQFISDEVKAALNTFPGDHSVQTDAYLPSVDGSPRLISAWLGTNLSIGAESINETALGDPF
jgi:hypothetical protein